MEKRRCSGSFVVSFFGLPRNKLRANPTKEYSKTPRSRRNKQPLPPIMKNVRPKPNNPTETRTIPARTQTAKLYSHLASNDLHLIPATYIAPSPRQHSCPAAADTPKGSGEVLERDRGSQSPVSFQPPPRGENKIYTYDVVFSPGEARIKSKE